MSSHATLGNGAEIIVGTTDDGTCNACGGTHRVSAIEMKHSRLIIRLCRQCFRYIKSQIG